MVFKGQRDAEIFAEYSHWLPFIQDFFLPLIDSETGDFRHYPKGSNLSNQDWPVMQILFHIQAVYRQVQSDRMKQIGKQ